MTITVELADGTPVDVDTDDIATAVAAARKFQERQTYAKTATPAPPLAAAGPGGTDLTYDQPEYKQAIVPPSGTEPSLGRGIAYGGQKAAEGVAGALGMPVDITNVFANAGRALSNMIFGTEIPGVYDPPGGKTRNVEMLRNAERSVGIDPLLEQDMSRTARLTGKMTELGTEALATGGAGTASAIARKAAGRPQTALTQPYADAIEAPTARQSMIAPAQDVGAGAGMAAASEGTSDLVGDNPWGQLFSSLAGGMTGAGVARAGVNGIPRTAEEIANRYIRRDRSVPFRGEDGQAPRVGVADEAARRMQNQAFDAPRAAENIREGVGTYAEGGMTPGQMPTPALMARDPGLIAAERAARRAEPRDFAARDRQTEQAAADQLETVRPAPLRGADADTREAASRTATDFAKGETEAEIAAAAARRQAAEEQVRTGKAAVSEKQRELEQQGAPFSTAAAPSKDVASKQVDEAVTGTLAERTAAKNEKFGAIDPNKDVQRPTGPIKEAAQRVRASASSLAPDDEVLPGGWLDKIDKAPDTMSFADLNDARAPLSSAIVKARRAGNYTLADNLRSLKSEIDSEADRLAAEGREIGMHDTTTGAEPSAREAAAGRAKDALDYYKTKYAPYFAQGEGKRFRDDVQGDPTRTKTPPTATAERFLFAGSGGEEAAADLRRILDISAPEKAGIQAARNYVVADMAKTVDATGKVSVPKLEAWVKSREGVFKAFPEIKDEVMSVLTAAKQGQTSLVRLQKELDGFVGNLKAEDRNLSDTKQRVGRSSLALLVDADPVVAVRKVFSSEDPTKAMREVKARLGKDPAAAEGWRNAVTDYLKETVTNAGVQRTEEGVRNVSPAKLNEMFTKHERVLEELYGRNSKEMDALRRVQRATVDLAHRGVTGGGVGSDTAENVAKQKVLDLGELVLKAKFGYLRGGGLFRTLRKAASMMPEIDNATQVGRIVAQAHFDPQLAAHLLERPVTEQAQQAWNVRLRRLMALQQFQGAQDERNDARRP